MADDDTLRYMAEELGRRVSVLEADRNVMVLNHLQNRSDIASIKDDVTEIKETQKDLRRDLRNFALAIAGALISGGLLYAISVALQ